MAYSLTTTSKSVHGNQRVFHGILTADAASGGVAIPGISVVESLSVICKSAATAGINVTINVTSSGVAANGSIQIKSAASGDVFYITVFGR